MFGTDTGGSLLKPPDKKDAKLLDIPTEILDYQTQIMGGDENVVGVDDDGVVVLKHVVCGPTDTAWLFSNGTCFVAGENKQGQLGVGHKNPVATPTRVQLPAVTNIVEENDNESDNVVGIQQVSLGSNFSAMVDTNGDLYTCGFGGSAFSGLGCLGHGNAESCTTFQLVTSLVQDGCRVQQVAASEFHMTVLTTEGEVLTTGAGSYGRLGNFDTVDQLYLEPVELLNQDFGNVTAIAGGKSFTLALTKDGVLHGWGRNHKGQLGTGFGMAVDMYAMQAIPEPITADELVSRRVIRVAAGHSHAACITESGELFFWGSSLHLEPVRVNDLLHTKIVDVACGQDYTLAVDVNGKMYSFGKGKTGVLGQGSVKQRNQATLMEAFGDKRVVQVSAGWKHAACLVED
jgi:alpha-tubulin suppressor-like RCC1 family protein